jgi:hypothetical protein
MIICGELPTLAETLRICLFAPSGLEGFELVGFDAGRCSMSNQVTVVEAIEAEVDRERGPWTASRGEPGMLSKDITERTEESCSESSFAKFEVFFFESVS